MLPAMRRARIIELLRRDGMASLKNLSDVLSVSVSTLRRDVEYLCDAGHLERTRGGAMLSESRIQSFEPSLEIAQKLESDAERAVGGRAAELIQPGQTVIFDSGTITAAAARAAVTRGVSFAAFTNDLPSKRHYEDHEQLRARLELFLDAYNHAHRLKTLKGLTPAQFIWKEWQSKPDLFHEEPCHLMTELNT